MNNIDDNQLSYRTSKNSDANHAIRDYLNVLLDTSIEDFQTSNHRSKSGIPVTTKSAAWRLLLNPNQHANVLEIGAGSNSVIHHLFSVRHTFTLIDTKPEKLDYSRTIHREWPDINIEYIDINSLNPELPAFDTILIHIPETFGQQGSILNYKSTLNTLLQNCVRLLTEKGKLILLCQNRWGYDKFLTLPFLNPLSPTKSFYLKSLAKAGFTNIAKYGTRQSSEYISGYLTLTPDNSVNPNFIRRNRQGWKNKLKETTMTPSFMFVSAQNKESLENTILDKLIANASIELAAQFGASEFIIENTTITRKNKFLAFALWGQQRLIVKFPLDTSATRSEIGNHENLQCLHKYSTKKYLYPRPLLHKKIAGQVCCIESRIIGDPLSKTMNRENREEHLDLIFSLLEEIKNTSEKSGAAISSIDLDTNLFFSLIQSKINHVHHHLRDLALCELLTQFFRDSLLGKTISIGILHGDFSVSNIFIKDNRLTGLIDWETSSLDGIPLLDSINYLDSTLRWTNPGMLVDQTIPALARRSLISKKESEFLDDCYNLYGIDPALHSPMVYLRWLNHISYLCHFWLKNNEQAQKRYIYDVAKHLATNFST